MSRAISVGGIASPLSVLFSVLFLLTQGCGSRAKPKDTGSRYAVIQANLSAAGGDFIVINRKEANPNKPYIFIPIRDYRTGDTQYWRLDTLRDMTAEARKSIEEKALPLAAPIPLSPERDNPLHRAYCAPLLLFKTTLDGIEAVIIVSRKDQWQLPHIFLSQRDGGYVPLELSPIAQERKEAVSKTASEFLAALTDRDNLLKTR
jgi:hypothetical protein